MCYKSEDSDIENYADDTCAPDTDTVISHYNPTSDKPFI